MNKIFCNKVTNMVEQIINIDTDTRWDENWFPNCYVIDDPLNEISTYNLRYNKEKEIFEVVEGMKEKEEAEVIPSEIEKMKTENELLRKEIDEIKNMINQTLINEEVI